MLESAVFTVQCVNVWFCIVKQVRHAAGCRTWNNLRTLYRPCNLITYIYIWYMAPSHFLHFKVFLRAKIVLKRPFHRKSFWTKISGTMFLAIEQKRSFHIHSCTLLICITRLLDYPLSPFRLLYYDVLPHMFLDTGQHSGTRAIILAYRIYDKP